MTINYGFCHLFSHGLLNLLSEVILFKLLSFLVLSLNNTKIYYLIQLKQNKSERINLKQFPRAITPNKSGNQKLIYLLKICGPNIDYDIVFN